MTELETKDFPDQASWEAWLAANHSSSPGVWVRIAKKGSQDTSVSYAEALDAALCWGWIDGQKRPDSETHWLQKFTRRGPRSVWSQVNQEKVHVLTDAGRMQPPGLAAVTAARADGRWDRAYAGQGTMPVPDDLRAALDLDPRAAAFFDGLTRSRRYSILFQVHHAKRDETRRARIEKYVRMCRDGVPPS